MPRTLSVTLNLENAAFRSEYGAVREIHECVTRALDRLDSQEYADGHGQTVLLRDSNGNTVGRMVLDADED